MGSGVGIPWTEMIGKYRMNNRADKLRCHSMLAGLMLLLPTVALAAGMPDLSGNYNVATLTPLERPKMFGDNLYLSSEAAEKIASDTATRKAQASKDSDPAREAPPAGGDGSRGAAGNVGGYNAFWIDNGVMHLRLTGSFGRPLFTIPPMAEE